MSCGGLHLLSLTFANRFLTKMHQRFVLAVAALVAFTTSAYADFTGLSYEIHATSAVGTTYRVYANFNDATDILQAVYAEYPNAMDISSGAGFYQDAFGGAFPTTINPLLYPSFPNLIYDTWITIGQEDNTPAQSAATVGGGAWNSAVVAFEAGGSFYVNDNVGGSVYVTPSNPLGQPIDGKVLIAQLTTTGTFAFSVNLQWRDTALNVYNETSLSLEMTSFQGLTYETVGENTSSDGFHTYRVYANFENPNDQLVAIFGIQDTALSITTTGTFYQNDFGGAFANSVNPLLYPNFPNLVYDSWLTIGGEDNNVDLQNLAVPTTDFENGGSVLIDDLYGGSWYIYPDLEPLAFPDALGRVLIGQFTTDGIVDMTVNLQYRAEDMSNPQEIGLQITFPVVIPGCTDAGACNYDSAADFDDGTCDFTSCAGCDEMGACNYNPIAPIIDNSLCEYPANYPNNTLDCDGNCINDTDNDDVCDEDEVPGCTDPNADNYSAEATDDDGSCVIAGCTDGDAQNFDASATEDDDTCEFLVIGTQGCTYVDATNYDMDADLDDGSCLFEGGSCSCPFDVNEDNIIGSADLIVFLAAFGGTCQ
jgi:hypothetical protein